MSNIDKQAVQAVADLKAGYTLGHADVAILNELARIALASLEAEAVAFRSKLKPPSAIGSENWDYTDHRQPDAFELENCVIEPLYTAQPAPVSVQDEATPDNIQMLASTYAPRGVTYQWDSDECNAAADSWNACRATMLQGAEPVTTAYKLPAKTPCKDAPEHIWLQTAGIWPENGEFSELTWCSENQHPDDTLYVRADVVPGNSPVVPDGWVMVPVEPTEDMIVNGFESEPDESFSDAEVWEAYDAMSGCQQAAHRAKLCWSAMISAAPKPDVR
ncbi:DUF551 domain-containing protein [Enterobacter cloacae]|uniref:DUF551 domain-containing protein n=1 Tax=Enterobacter cloacae TaxID=550 RepID=UPI002A80833D|nr:DUF551 domain-containing protein [Enterobacter cloacae]